MLQHKKKCVHLPICVFVNILNVKELQFSSMSSKAQVRHVNWPERHFVENICMTRMHFKYNFIKKRNCRDLVHPVIATKRH